MVKITMISKEGVASQKFIPSLQDTIYKVVSMQERKIQLQCEKDTYTYLKWSLRLKLYNPDVVF